jgi:hypothetical protein
MAEVFAQEPPPDFDARDRQEADERLELEAEGAVDKLALLQRRGRPVEGSGRIDRKPGDGETVGAGQSPRPDADELLEPTQGSSIAPQQRCGRPREQRRH